MRIDGSVALVTGAAGGVGGAVAAALLERGAARVYPAARRPAELPAELTGDPRSVPVALDLTDPASVARAAEVGRDVTLLFNIAGIARFGPAIGAPSMADAREQMDTNYFGTLRMCRAFAPVLARNGGGALVTMLSVVSFFALPGMGTFCPTKAALWSLTHAVRGELRAQGTQVTSVHAGFIDTRLTEEFDVPKLAPAAVAASVLDGVEAGREELLLDEHTRETKRALPRDLELIYPEVERQWRAATG